MATQQTILELFRKGSEGKKRRLVEVVGESGDDSADPLLPLLTEIASIKPTVEDTNKVVKNLQTNHAALSRTVNDNSKAILNLSSRINIIDQRYYESMMEISGVGPATIENAKDNLHAYALEIIQTTSPSITASHFDKPYVRKFKVAAGEKVVIVLRFYSKSVRVMVMAARRNAKLNDGIFFNEILTSANRALSYEARKAKKEGKIAQVWTLDGTVCVRKTEGAPMKKIFSITDLTDVCATTTAHTGNQL